MSTTVCPVITRHTVPKSGPWPPGAVPLTPPETPPETPPTTAVSRREVHQTSYFDEIDLARETTASNARVAVIGTGYVGLHLVEAFSGKFPVIAFDVSDKRLREVQRIVRGNVTCTSDPSRLSAATHFLISVPTVLDSQSRLIDTSFIESAIDTIRTYARPGSTVIIESSVAVGMTRKLLTPLMISLSLKCGMSPERVDPGRTYPHYSDIPKIISGLDGQSLLAIEDIYSAVFRNLVKVSSPEVAEMTKLYENCQRMICIAYANEMADACVELSRTLTAQTQDPHSAPIHIDAWEVCQAAATKPFGYQPYTPSLGVGGHCIPVNPYYLLSNSSFPLLEACTQRMHDRPRRIADDIMLRLQAKTLAKRPRILVVGMGFKRGQATLANSPGKALVVHLLSTYEVYVEYADPLVSQDALPFIPRMDDSQCWTQEYLCQFDSIVVAVNQPGLDLEMVKEVEAKGTFVEWWCKISV